MRDIAVHWTLEDLFCNIPTLTPQEIQAWLAMKGTSERELPFLTDIICSTYQGWLEGKFFVEGDKVGLREWHEN